MANRTCSVDGCNKRSRVRGWCPMHYRRWRLHGDVLRAAGYNRGTPIERVLQRVVHQDGPLSTPCWVCTYAPDRLGYTHVAATGTRSLAHRVTYEHFIGPIGPGLVLDHLCRNPPCVNPAHLEAVTQGENIRRGMSPAAIASRTNICYRGHPLDGHNVMSRSDGARQCRECREASRRELYALRRQSKENTQCHPFSGFSPSS